MIKESIFCDGFIKFKDLEYGGSYKSMTDGKIYVRTIDRDLKKYNRNLYKFLQKHLYEGGEKTKKKRKYSNNVCEYFALYMALFYSRLQLSQSKNKIINIYSDSLLIVNQMNKKWGVNSAVLKKLHSCCNDIKTNNINIIWISRSRIVKELGH